MIADASSTRREPVNILLVDDQPAKLLSYETILGDLGEKLLKASSGREALEHLLKHDVAVVLMDVCMPEMDGFELAAMIRQHPRFQKTAIILVSAINQSDLDRLKGYDSGAMDYIAVPVIPEILRAKVSVFVDLYRKTHDLHALNSKLQRQAHLLDQTYDAIFAWEPGGMLIYWNKASEELYGFRSEEAVGRPVHELLATDYLCSREEFLETLQQDGVWAGELIHRRRDGRRLVIESRMRLVPSEHQPLVLQVNRDVTRRKELEREVLEVVTMEQQRIGQELHDGVNQELYALDLIATALSKRLQKSAPDEESRAEKISLGLSRVQRQIRALARGLVPMEIDPEGLRAALEDLVARISEQHSRIACMLYCPQRVEIEESIVATHLHGIAQESVYNAVRHSRASSIQLSLQQDEDRVVLAIRDNGVGVDLPLNDSKGLGLRLMQHRAAVIGGRLSISPADGGGTVVTCVTPLKTRNRYGGRALEAVSDLMLEPPVGRDDPDDFQGLPVSDSVGRSEPPSKKQLALL